MRWLYSTVCFCLDTCLDCVFFDGDLVVDDVGHLSVQIRCLVLELDVVFHWLLRRMVHFHHYFAEFGYVSAFALVDGYTDLLSEILQHGCCSWVCWKMLVQYKCLVHYGVEDF